MKFSGLLCLIIGLTINIVVRKIPKTNDKKDANLNLDNSVLEEFYAKKYQICEFWLQILKSWSGT